MSRLDGRPGAFDRRGTETALAALARLHACFYGSRADEAVAGGLQAQGTMSYLDTRKDEFDSMPTRGWEGRLRLAARAIDERLKADQARLDGDRAVAALREERLQLKESVLTAEETALTVMLRAEAEATAGGGAAGGAPAQRRRRHQGRVRAAQEAPTACNAVPCKHAQAGRYSGASGT